MDRPERRATLDSKIQTGLRIPKNRYNELKDMANKSGASINSIILFFVEIGLSAFTLGIEQEAHFAPRSLQCTDE